jgi:hypothetical protein
MPLGIPQQSEQARGALRKATIGQITDGSGSREHQPKEDAYG